MLLHHGNTIKELDLSGRKLKKLQIRSPRR